MFPAAAHLRLVELIHRALLLRGCQLQIQGSSQAGAVGMHTGHCVGLLQLLQLGLRMLNVIEALQLLLHDAGRGL